MKKIFVAALCATTAMSFAQTTANLDDFEDGDGLANTGGAKDAWYAYTDVNDKGASTYTNTKDQYGLVVVMEEAAAGGSKYGAGLTGISLAKGSNPDDPYVVLAVNVAGGLSGCTTISYKYKGAGHNLKATMNGDDSGDLTGYNRHAYALDGSTSWTNASVSVSQLKQATGWGTTLSLNMANVVSLSWEVKGTATSDYLYIDDVNCAGYTPGSSSTTTPSTAVVIDDFEDANTTAETLSKTAYWYIYTAGGKVGNTQDANESWDILDSADGTNHWVTMKGISGITPGSDKDEIYTSVGMEVAFTSGVLSGCTAVQYDYKGSGHRMRSTVDGVTVNKGWEHVATDQPASTDWKTVTVSTMAQPDWISTVTGATVVAFSWAKVSRLTWVVDEKFSAANLGTSLSIDNVKCVGTLGAATTKPSSSSTIPASSNSNAANNNANNNNANNNANNNNATNPGMNTAIGVVAAPAGLSATLHGNTLQVSVAKAGLVKVQVFDMMGHAIESHSENMTAGSFAHSFANMSKGAYIIRVQQGSMVKTVRMQVR